MNGKNFVLIVAGGLGSRMKQAIPKQYLELQNKTILSYTIEAFLKNEHVDFVKVVISKAHTNLYLKTISRFNDTKLLLYQIGGETRSKSVLSGLKSYSNHSTSRNDKVLIHDAARPFISQNIINQLFLKLDHSQAVFPIIPISDALWYEHKKSLTFGPERNNLFRAQTPQAFYFQMFYSLCSNDFSSNLDDIAVAKKHNLKISSIPGDPFNIKITNVEDLQFARQVAKIWT